MNSPALWKKYLSVLITSVILFIAPLIRAQATTIPNPLRVTTFLDLVQVVAQAVVAIAIPFAAIAIIFVGLQLVIASASGNPGAITKAKTTLLYVLIGTAIIVGASALAIAVVNTVKNITAQ